MNKTNWKLFLCVVSSCAISVTSYGMISYGDGIPHSCEKKDSYVGGYVESPRDLSTSISKKFVASFVSGIINKKKIVGLQKKSSSKHKRTRTIGSPRDKKDIEQDFGQGNCLFLLEEEEQEKDFQFWWSKFSKEEK